MLEERIQRAISTSLHRHGIFHHGDTIGMVRSKVLGGRAKMMGARKGFPDLFILLPNRPIWIELKTIRGQTSPEQRKVHKQMAELGAEVWVVKARNEEDGVRKVWKILSSRPES